MRVYCLVVRDGEGSRERALKEILKKFGVDGDLNVEKDENGRPFLPDFPTLDISVTHCKPYSAYAVSDGRIGIDMELPDRIRDPMKLSARFFTEAENRQIEQASDPAFAVCEVWTKKEALAKHIGTGLSKTYHLDTTTQQNNIIFQTFPPTETQIPPILTICSSTHSQIEVFIQPKNLILER